MGVLKKPLVSEKMALMNERASSTNNQYAFEVDWNAKKPDIKQEIEKMYDVTVQSVRTMKYAGKRRMRYTRAGFISGRSPHFKKAIITLKEGDEIDFYKNI